MDIEVLILAQLMQGPKHGYEIKKNIIFVMHNNKIINNNTLYPKLKQFEKRGDVVKNLVEQEGRPNRYVYSITDAGQKVFYHALNHFTLETVESDDEWSIRLAFYNLLNQEKRRELLSYRRKHVADKLQRLEQLSMIVGDSKFKMYSPELYFYTQSMLEKEIELIESLDDQLDQ
ncbi:Transcriptional regulator PadR-like family protein [compost metagenome]